MASKKPLVVGSEIEQLQAGDSLTVGDYDIPNAVGANGTILQVDTGVAVWDTPGNLYVGDADYYVTLTGNDSDTGGAGDPWETIDHAIEEISKIDFLNDAKITIHVGDGVHTISSNIAINKTATTLLIRGINDAMTFAASEVVSVNSLGGNEYDLRLTLNTTTGLTTDQCVGIFGSAVKWYLNGGWRIITVHDSTDITIRMGCTNFTPTTGSMTPSITLRVPKTILDITALRGLDVRANNVQFSHLTFVGTGSNRGIYANGVSGLHLVEQVIFNGFGTGLGAYLTLGGVDDCYAGFCVNGFYAQASSSIVVSASAAGFCSNGIKATGAWVEADSCYLVGNVVGAEGIGVAFLQVSNSDIRGSTLGMRIRYLTYGRSISVTYSNNGTDRSPTTGDGNFQSHMRVT